MRRRLALSEISFLDIVDELNQTSNRLIIPQEEWRSAELSTSWGDWDEVKDHTPLDPAKIFVLVSRGTGSDYSGDLVEKSNYEVLSDDADAAALAQGDDYLLYAGGHGTFGIAFRVAAMPPSIVEMVYALEDYPIADESRHSQMEHEAQEAAWQDYTRKDFHKALVKQLKSAFEERIDDPAFFDYLEDDWADEHTDQIDRWAHTLTEIANVYWRNEQGDSMYIDVDAMAAAIYKELPARCEWSVEKQAELRPAIEASVVRGYEKHFYAVLARQLGLDQPC